MLQAKQLLSPNAKKITANSLRCFLGAFFIFSGLTKLNDPLGLAFKLEEYFSPEVLNLGFLEPFAVGIAVFVIALEVMLGVMLIMGRMKKFTLAAFLALNIFFTFLTFYSAAFDKVTHCGCFGDAIPLRSWQSFAKDVALLSLTVVLCTLWRSIRPIAGFRTFLAIMALTLAASVGSMYYVLKHRPFIDFRPYKVGVNIPEAMEYPEDAEPDVYENIWIYKMGGKEKKYGDADQPWNIEGAEFVDRQSRLVKKGYEPSIVNFNIISQAGDDLTYRLMEKDTLYLVLAYNLAGSDEKAWEAVKSKIPADKAIILTSTSGPELELYLKEHDIKLTPYFTDPITIKTIERGNPAVVLLKKGTVTKKLGWREL